MLFSNLNFSPAERGVGLASGIIAFAGILVALFAVSLLSGAQHSVTDITLQNAWVCLCGALGALWAAYLCRDWVGHSGHYGHLWAALAAGAVTFLGSVAGGSLVLPIYGTMFGPFSVAMTFIANPAVAIVWCGALLSGHLAMIKWREERDTVFDAKLSPPEPILRF